MTILIALTLVIALTFVLAVIVVFNEFPDAAVDEARNSLFEIRDELFELGRQEVAPFNSDAYVFHRNLLNGMIRYAHEISVLDMFVTMLIFRKKNQRLGERWSKQMNVALSELDAENRAQLERVAEKATLVMAKLMISRSPVACLILGAAAAVVAACQMMSSAYANRRALNQESTSRGRIDASVEEILSEEHLLPVRAQIRIQSAKHMPVHVSENHLVAA